MTSYHNLTLMLISMGELALSPANHSIAQNVPEAAGQYTRLIEMLQRLNGSNLPNLTQNELMERFLNQSQAHFGLSSSYSNLDKKLSEAEQEQEESISVWLTISLYAIYAAICLLGACGNTLVCYAVFRNPTMHTVTNTFIFNLAISDLLLCLFCVPFTPLYLLTFKSWNFGTTLCHLLPFAQGVSIYISAFTLMSIAIDRYFVILYPFKARMQMATCVFIIVAIWLTTSVLTAPYAHFMQLVQAEDGSAIYCDERWPTEETRKTFAIGTTIVQFVIPFIIITFCYVRVCGKLWHRANTIPGNVSARREEQERERTRRTNGMLISMVVIFVISWLPLNIHNLLMDFFAEASQWQYQQTTFLFVHAAAMSSACYNPFLYAWLNENFRKEFKEILPCCGKLKRTLFTSTLVELQQANARRSSCPNSSKRCVKLHLTEPEKQSQECMERSKRAHSMDLGREQANEAMTNLCVTSGSFKCDEAGNRAECSNSSSGQMTSQTTTSSQVNFSQNGDQQCELLFQVELLSD